MSTIEYTVESALRSAGHGDYIRYADQAVQALTEREGRISQAIIVAAVAAEIDEGTIRDLLTGLDMYVLPVTTADHGTEEVTLNGVPANIETALANMGRTIDALVQAARDNGITIRV